MNRTAFEEGIRQSVAIYAASIDVPGVDVTSIRARAVDAREVGAPVARKRRPRLLTMAATTAVLLILALSAPAVIAGVQRVMQAFIVTNGQRVPLSVRTVSLDQARADMPFTVIVPAAIPTGLQPTIRELGSGANAHLMFAYSNGGSQLPGLTIMESAAGEPQPNMQFMESIGKHALPPPSALPSGQSAQMQWKLRGGQVLKRYKIEPIVWTERGTRVSILAAPSLTRAQLEAIRSAMQR